MAILKGLNKNLVSKSLVTQIIFLIDLMDESIIKIGNQDSSEFHKISVDIKNRSLSIINTNTIGDELVTLFDAYNSVADTSDDKYFLCTQIFGFNSFGTQITSNKPLSELSNIINLTIRYINLAEAYNNAVNIEFTNFSELSKVIDELDAEYEVVINDPLLGNDANKSMVTIKTQCMRFFSSLNLKALSTINTSIVSSRLLAYRLYKDSTQADDIIKLNKINNTGFLEGNITITSPIDTQ